METKTNETDNGKGYLELKSNKSDHINWPKTFCYLALLVFQALILWYTINELVQEYRQSSVSTDLDDRCVVYSNDGTVVNYKECDTGYSCVTTGEFSKCISCNTDKWEKYCEHWTYPFLNAAEKVCDKTCESISSTSDMYELCTPNNSEKSDVDVWNCREGLTCVQLGNDYAQCFDCGNEWQYHCWQLPKEYLKKVEQHCNRSCILEKQYEKQVCYTDNDCMEGDYCLSTDAFAQCVSCESNTYQTECQGWESDVMLLAEMKCNKKCELE